MFYSIYRVRLAIKFHNTAVLHSENLPSLWKQSPFLTCIPTPNWWLLSIPHTFLLLLFQIPQIWQLYQGTIRSSFLPLVLQSKPQGSPHIWPDWTKSPAAPLHTSNTSVQVYLLQESDLQLGKSEATASWNVVHRHFLVLMWVCGA